MKDTSTSDNAATNLNSEIISNEMECDSTKSKDATIDEAPYVKPTIQNTSEIKATESKSMEVVSANHEIKMEGVTVKNVENQNDSLDNGQKYDDIVVKTENTDSTLTNIIENRSEPKNEATTNIKAESNEMDTSEPKSEPTTVSDSTKSEIEKNTGNENKTNNSIVFKRKRSRKGRTRPSKKARLRNEKAAAASKIYENICSPESKVDDVEYCLTVTNLPNSWSFMDIKNYVDVQCGPVDEIEMVKDDNTGNGAIRLSYQTEEECKKAMENLKDKEIEGSKLVVSMSVVSLDQENEMQPNTPEPPSVHSNADNTGDVVATPFVPQWRPDLDIWEIDPRGLYGLKESFLKSLDITPPLDKWVHVTNFRCDKSEIRDVLEMAGKVLMCTVFLTTPKYANVMYSHPLEAVQAVSMLNGQTFYGQTLKVVMDRSPMNTILLPKGLNDVGMGLGANGKPLRTVVKHFHRYMNNQSASLNRSAFEMPDNLSLDGVEVVEESFTLKNVEEFNYVLPKEVNKGKTTNNVDPPKVNSPVTKPKPEKKPEKIEVKSEIIDRKPVLPPAKSPVRPSFPNQNFQQRNFGPNFGHCGPRPGWGGPRPDPRMNGPFGPGPGPRPGWNGPGPMGPMAGPRPMPGPMHGPMNGPMHGPMAGPRPMPGPMNGPMQGQMSGPMQRPMQGPMQGQMQGPMQGPMQPMQGPMQGSMPRPMQGPMQGPRPMGPGFDPGNEPVQLQFSNLPPSTTFAILCEKMAACGQVVSIQLTTPGCAVVTFANRSQADMCYQSYNNMCVEGCVIQVKYSPMHR